MGAEIETDRYPDTGFSMKDTSPEVNAMMFQKLMALSGVERMKMGFSMRASAKKMIEAGLPEGLSTEERNRMVYERMYGEPLPPDCPAGGS